MTISIEHVINTLIKTAPKRDKTVDKLETGRIEDTITGIATTFMATHNVIQQAIKLKVNFIITHESLYYHHHNQIDHLFNDPIYINKRDLILQNSIAIYRLHDAIHLHQPDLITSALIRNLAWEDYIVKNRPAESILILPNMTLGEIANYLKKKLGIPYVRVVGNLSRICKRTAISVGYRGGGENAIPIFNNEQIDLLITGEGPEWETPEYVRDAVQQGQSKALIFLGHAESEKAGMQYLANEMKSYYNSVPVHYLEDKPIFQII